MYSQDMNLKLDREGKINQLPHISHEKGSNMYSQDMNLKLDRVYIYIYHFSISYILIV
jgi:hypothetical protein